MIRGVCVATTPGLVTYVNLLPPPVADGEEFCAS